MARTLPSQHTFFLSQKAIADDKSLSQSPCSRTYIFTFPQQKFTDQTSCLDSSIIENATFVLFQTN